MDTVLATKKTKKNYNTVLTMCFFQKTLSTGLAFLYKYHSLDMDTVLQGFQSGPVPGTFTRLRSCIVPSEITEPPKISGGQNHKYDWLVEYFS